MRIGSANATGGPGAGSGAEPQQELEQEQQLGDGVWPGAGSARNAFRGRHCDVPLGFIINNAEPVAPPLRNASVLFAPPG